jgi:trk system potassium uptake protein TrkH
MAAERKREKVVSAAPAALVGGAGGFGQELVNWLFPGYVTLIVLCVGAFVTRWTMVTGHEMPLDRAVLTAVNAATLTGFPEGAVNPNWLRPFGQFLILLLTVAGSLFSLLVGGMAVARILRLPCNDKQILRASLIAEAVALILGSCGLCGSGSGPLTGLSQGAAAFGNCGMALGTPYGLNNWQTHLIVLPMAFLGGLGITVLIELFRSELGVRPLSNHAVKSLAMSLGLYVVALVVLVAVRSMIASYDGDFRSLVASSSAAAINSRTLGMPLEMAHQWPRFMQWFVVLLMMIGGSSGGTAGGLKTTTVVALFRGTLAVLRGQLPGRQFGIALCWLGLYLLMAFIGLVLLLGAEPQLEGDKLAFMTISGLSNVGLALDIVNITARGSYILSALMLCGRMVPLLILWWMADTTRDADLAVG